VAESRKALRKVEGQINGGNGRMAGMAERMAEWQNEVEGILLFFS
jgi:hypothetical protein